MPPDFDLHALAVELEQRSHLHMHPASEILKFFSYKHLPERLQSISRPFHDLAHEMAGNLDGPEVTVGLRKMIEAKDCFVRAALPPDDVGR